MNYFPIKDEALPQGSFVMIGVNVSFVYMLTCIAATIEIMILGTSELLDHTRYGTVVALLCTVLTMGLAVQVESVHAFETWTNYPKWRPSVKAGIFMIVGFCLTMGSIAYIR
ncbi:hypothetical protein OTK49_03005 [Vibrio coralliirubri]|uniref:hypothetical protein n=1 Tax=Vibrio coralliirubri TaxID=1516159 RepID=UPI0022843033|nr:hypothetical protein [Vibrio coralliirubri]MCY9861484.1 hypothetical protein [Vibrio coralliirubri]